MAFSVTCVSEGIATKLPGEMSEAGIFTTCCLDATKHAAARLRILAQTIQIIRKRVCASR